ncbi:MAG: hypothetical protein NUW01_07930 [Gemmatimonadaceae bacterium]|nr:hypothetical protein [Gemmatimonadaceae bacterium]
MFGLFEGAYLHLLINHAPIFGSVFAFLLLLASYFVARNVLRLTAFAILIATAPLAFIAQRSGEPAEDAIRGFPGVQRSVIHDHEEMGEKAYLISIAVGVLALGAAVRWRARPVPGSAAVVMTLATAFATGAMAYTGLLGGRVRHTEVRPGAVSADAMTIEPRRQRPPGATP